VASDGDGEHSPFATALLKHLTEPGLDLRIAFGRVRDDVLKTTGNRQEPFVYGSLGGNTMALVPQTAKPIDPEAEARVDYELAAQVGTKEGVGLVPCATQDRIVCGSCPRTKQKAVGRTTNARKSR
jgi:hypothetical protein